MIADQHRHQPENRAAWRKWLRANHAKSTGVWCVFVKGAARQLSYDAAVEEALCFGWIDSLMRSIDERSYMQLFTPRKPRSGWSAANKRRIESLIARKLMARPGLEKVEAAKNDGSWTKLDAIETLIVPPDVARALARNKKARAFFDAQPPSSRKACLYWVTGVKDPQRRAERIAHLVAQAAKGLRPAAHEAWLAKTKATARSRRKASAAGRG